MIAQWIANIWLWWASLWVRWLGWPETEVPEGDNEEPECG